MTKELVIIAGLFVATLLFATVAFRDERRISELEDELSDDWLDEALGFYKKIKGE